mmetsp:Transcript_40605/g.98059  ORF Transcript_40605/g.98059 Transcript_40605/m.98059 type:complete len:680 (+) Transcript_40605:125-2164(+)
MKFRSVLKKLKKKKKPSSEGVVDDETVPVPLSTSFVAPEEEMEVSTSPAKMLKSTSNPSIAGSWEPVLQKASAEQASASASPNKHQLRHRFETNKTRSDVQQTEPSSAKVAQASAKSKQRSDSKSNSNSIQDEFGVDQKASFAPPNDGTWASFGDSSGFFNNSTEHSSSLFTASTAAETESESTRRHDMSSSSLSTMSSPANSSFRSTRSQDLSSPSDLSRFPRSSSTLSSLANDTEENKPRSPTTTGSPSSQAEGRSDMSLPPLPESLQQAGSTQDKRQRPSPTRSPVSSKSPMSSPPSQESSLGAASPPKPARRSITERYTAALNPSSSSAAASSSPVAPTKLFRSPSKTSVLDNHPLFRKRSMVEQKQQPQQQQETGNQPLFRKRSMVEQEETPVKQPEEREEPEVVVAAAPVAAVDSTTTTPQQQSPPSTKFIRKSASSNSILADYVEKVKEEEEEQQGPTLAAPTKLFADNAEDPMDASANSAAAVMATDAAAATASDGKVDATWDVAAMDALPTMEQEQPESPQEEQEQQEEPNVKPEDGEEEMPILSTSPEFDAIPPSSQVETTDQSSKATTVSNNDSQGGDSAAETAPIGDLSFDDADDDADSHSEGSHTHEDYTVDSRDFTLLSEDYTTYTHELRRSKKPSDRISRWIENTIFGMANFMCPMEEGDVYDA